MNGKKLKNKLFEVEMTYAQCAKELGISVTTFNYRINGKKPFTIPEVQKLVSILHLTEEEKKSIFLI